MGCRTSHLPQVFINLEHLAHNVLLLQGLIGSRRLWPVIKANAYGHGADIIGKYLVTLGYTPVCVAHVAEAVELVEAGVHATYIVLAAPLPEHSEYCVAYGFEPVVCTLEMVESLARAAVRLGKRVAVHLKVDTGMGRLGIQPQEVTTFLEKCREFPAVTVKGLMSHFPRADELEQSFSHRQVEIFRQLQNVTRRRGIAVYHLATSAALFALPEAYFDAVRPGIALYGLKPSHTIRHPSAHTLILGQQGEDHITADELADKLGTINYEIVTSISKRVPRITVSPGHVEDA